MGLNLASVVTESAERAPEAVAVRLAPLELSYAELDDRSARLATLLREKGLEQGDRIGVMLPNVLEFPITYYGVLRAGCAVPHESRVNRRFLSSRPSPRGAASR